MQATIEFYGMRVAPKYQRLHQWGSRPLHHHAQMRVEESESESDEESDENDTFDESAYETNTDDYTWAMPVDYGSFINESAYYRPTQQASFARPKNHYRTQQSRQVYADDYE